MAPKKRHAFYGLSEESIEIVKIYAIKSKLGDGEALDKIIKDWNELINKEKENNNE